MCTGDEHLADHRRHLAHQKSAGKTLLFCQSDVLKVIKYMLAGKTHHGEDPRFKLIVLFHQFFYILLFRFRHRRELGEGGKDGQFVDNL